jgi:hypothetical protein
MQDMGGGKLNLDDNEVSKGLSVYIVICMSSEESE